MAYKDPEVKRIKNREWREKHPDYNKDYGRELRAKHPEKAKRYEQARGFGNRVKATKLYRQKAENFLKVKARKTVANALKMNKLQRPQECFDCGDFCIPEAHHKDYSKPLEVVWLCKKCHESLHHPIA